MTSGWHILRLDLAGALRGGGAGVPLAFFLLVALLAPLAVGGDPELSRRLSGGIIWLGAMLATLLCVDRMFRADLEDGSLALLRTAPLPLEAVGLAKCAANWLLTGAPVLVAAPVAALLHGVSGEQALRLLLSLAVGTPALTLLGGTVAALTTGLRAPGLLIPVLSLPLAGPVLLFGTVAADPALGAHREATLLLAACTLAALAGAPFAIAAALRQADR